MLQLPVLKIIKILPLGDAAGSRVPHSDNLRHPSRSSEGARHHLLEENFPHHHRKRS